jgi:hypothetical protein
MWVSENFAVPAQLRIDVGGGGGVAAEGPVISPFTHAADARTAANNDDHPIPRFAIRASRRHDRRLMKETRRREERRIGDPGDREHTARQP